MFCDAENSHKVTYLYGLEELDESLSNFGFWRQWHDDRKLPPEPRPLSTSSQLASP